MKNFSKASCLATLLCLPALAAGTPDAVRPSSPPARPAEPALRLTAQGAFDAPAARAGDTVWYRLRVEWREVPAAVMLLPREELETPGLRTVGRAAAHHKSSRPASPDGEVLNVTEFTYALLALEAGTARVAPFALRYHNGLTGREETVNVPGARIEIAPPRKPLSQRTGMRVLALLVAIAALAELLRRLRARRRVTRRAKPPGDGPDAPFARELQTLGARRDGADSRVWVADAERLCTAWLCGRIGVSNPAHVRFEAALDQYLERRPGLPPGEKESWVTLRELFHEDRYAGRRREPHELHGIFRHMKNCLRQEKNRLRQEKNHPRHEGEPSP